MTFHYFHLFSTISYRIFSKLGKWKHVLTKLLFFFYTKKLDIFYMKSVVARNISNNIQAKFLLCNIFMLLLSYPEYDICVYMCIHKSTHYQNWCISKSRNFFDFMMHTVRVEKKMEITSQHSNILKPYPTICLCNVHTMYCTHIPWMMELRNVPALYKI